MADTLEGWAVPIQGTPWDHTYVVGPSGMKWKCWGRDTGGRPVVAGMGDASVAGCLSQPDSEAGIRYGVTGVCHQTANRILFPAGRAKVDACNGYAVSSFLYRDYGLGDWPQFLACTNPSASIADPAANGLVKMGGYNGAGSKVNAMATVQESAQVDELSALVQKSLGRPLDGATLGSLLANQEWLRQRQGELVTAFDAGQLTPEEYLKRLNEALRSTMEFNRYLLGDERFFKIFGEAGVRPEGLVDRQTFLARTKRARVP